MVIHMCTCMRSCGIILFRPLLQQRIKTLQRIDSYQKSNKLGAADVTSIHVVHRIMHSTVHLEADNATALYLYLGLKLRLVVIQLCWPQVTNLLDNHQSIINWQS